MPYKERDYEISRLQAGTLVVAVASDFICPWCFVGKRRLGKALGILAGHGDPHITWLPFRLNPHMPRESR